MLRISNSFHQILKIPKWPKVTKEFQKNPQELQGLIFQEFLNRCIKFVENRRGSSIPTDKNLSIYYQYIYLFIYLFILYHDSGAKFNRVLPLPGDSWSEAASDWYCHLHGDATDINKQLKPRPTDCLFGSSSYALPFNAVVAACQSHTQSCFNCQAPIARFTDDMVNFWCHAVRWFHYHGDESLEAMPTLTAIEAFYQAFNEALKKEEESFFGRKLLFKSGAEALTIWLIGDDDFTMEGAGTSIVDLTSSDKRRVLFKFEPQHLVNKSSNISEHVISHAMLHDVLDVLLKSTFLLPPTCRLVRDFSLGFLPVFT